MGAAGAASALRKLQASETLFPDPSASPAVRSGAPDGGKAGMGLAQASGFPDVMFAGEGHVFILLLFIVQFYTVTQGLLVISPSRRGSNL